MHKKIYLKKSKNICS